MRNDVIVIRHEGYRGGLGIRELLIPAAIVKRKGGSIMKMQAGCNTRSGTP